MRGWDRAVKGVALCTTLLGMSSGALAAAGLTSATVEAIAPVVTYSRPANPPKVAALTTYIGFSVVGTNTSGNTINDVVFEGRLQINDPQEIASFDSADGISCSLVPPIGPGNSVTISCPIGQMKAGSSKRFTLFFVAPQQDTTSPPPNAVDFADFSGRILTAEGANKGNSPNDSVDFWPLTGATCPGGSLENPQAATHLCIKVDLGTPSPTEVKSAVRKAGGTFFTGEGGITGLLNGDPFTTTVTIPNSAIISRASIVESETLPTSNFINSWKTDLQILNDETDATADFQPALLTILLRMDAANIRPGTKINSVVIKHNGVTVLDCPTPNSVTQPGIPCIAERKYYKNRGVSGWTPELDGDFQWKVLSTGNGVFEFF